eukprot:scaffold2728_cov215-Prasinococcus_capsulatus_cf.AAC.1
MHFKRALARQKRQALLSRAPRRGRTLASPPHTCTAAALLQVQAPSHACCGGAAVVAPWAVRIYAYKGSTQPDLIVQ